MAKPAVDGLHKDLETRGIELLRLNVRDSVGAQVARAYGVQGVPTLAVFDGAGDIVLSQSGFVNPDQVLLTIDSF